MRREFATPGLVRRLFLVDHVEDGRDAEIRGSGGLGGRARSLEENLLNLGDLRVAATPRGRGARP